jgi:hypothetical protein
VVKTNSEITVSKRIIHQCWLVSHHRLAQVCVCARPPHTHDARTLSLSLSTYYPQSFPSLPVLGSSLKQWMFPFLWIPKWSPSSTKSDSWHTQHTKHLYCSGWLLGWWQSHANLPLFWLTDSTLKLFSLQDFRKDRNRKQVPHCFILVTTEIASLRGHCSVTASIYLFIPMLLNYPATALGPGINYTGPRKALLEFVSFIF